MRRLLVAALLMGCVHQPALIPQERCSASGMVLAGATFSSGGAVAVSGSYVATARSYGEAVSCRRPETTVEMCEVRAFETSRMVKQGWSPTGRNVLIGIGYVLYILPGIVLYFVFDSSADDAADRAVAARHAVLATCR